MRLRDQALIAVGAACLCCGGCARLLTAFLAPQEAAMSAAGQVAGKVTAPAQSELSRMGSEVDRLLAGKGANKEELQIIQRELNRRNPATRPRDGSAQADPERLRPWHPRVAEADPRAQLVARRDDLVVERPVTERGMPVNGTLPDGIPAAELRTPIGLSRIRVEKPR